MVILIKELNDSEKYWEVFFVISRFQIVTWVTLKLKVKISRNEIPRIVNFGQFLFDWIINEQQRHKSSAAMHNGESKQTFPEWIWLVRKYHSEVISDGFGTWSLIKDDKKIHPCYFSPSYFTCFYEEYVLQRCPDGFWFERTNEVCDLPHNVFTCEFAPPPAPPETTTLASTTRRPNPVDCEVDGVTHLPNPYSCTRFFMCFDGVAVEQSCSPGLYFSRSQLRCVRRAESDCLLDGETCPAVNDPDNIVFFPDQDDCQM